MNGGKESFVHRWARRAHQARQEREAEAAARTGVEEPKPEQQLEPELEAEGLPELPPIETLDANSDYTAFLGANVPKVLRAAALRKAWTSDPVIAAHRPLVEYDWDCNAPGYGALKPNDQTGKLAQNLLRHFRPKDEPTEEPAMDIELADAAEDPAPAALDEASGPGRTAAVEADTQEVAAVDAPDALGEKASNVLPRDEEVRPIRHGGARPA